MKMGNTVEGLKVGDVVTLKSDGPAMTVQEFVELGGASGMGNNHYRCQWFVAKKLESGVFPEDSLQKLQPRTYG
jgi:uncharacterized protein YodC (DUF2158 family)